MAKFRITHASSPRAALSGKPDGSAEEVEAEEYQLVGEWFLFTRNTSQPGQKPSSDVILRIRASDVSRVDLISD